MTEPMSEPMAEPMAAASAAPAATPTEDRLLELDDLHVFYGNIEALKGMSMHVNRGEIVTLIGSNGAGKSTTLKTISGVLRPRTGVVRLDGREIQHTPPHDIVKLGIAQSPEGRRVFARMSVYENLQMGAFARRGEKIDDDVARVYELFPRLKERRSQKAGTMSGGEQQMLAMGRALMAAPKVLLLDEPSMGLSPILTEQIFSIITEINGQGTTVLLVEQNALMALNVAHRGYVLQTGRIILHDTAANLAANEQVRQAYLGEI
jgi:branched-chain amino acid transport system ATP-binding protein